MMQKVILFIISILIIFQIGVTDVNAFVIQTRSEMKIDESISDQSQKVTLAPKSIIITRIITPVEDYLQDPALWYSSLYYYSITRLGFLDIPYNLIIDRDGKVYEGRAKGIFTDPETFKQQGTLVIGYLSNDDDLSALASNSLKQIITEISYTYGIPRKNVAVQKMYLADTGTQLTKADFKEDTTDFSKNVSNELNTYKYSDIEHLEYKAEVKDVVYAKSLKMTEKMTVDVTFVNKNDFPWFANNQPIYLSTKGNKESPFAVNGKWESFSKPLVIDDKVIMPGEELKVSFEIQAMLLSGTYSQKFVLMKLPKTVFSGSEFSVDFKVEKGNFKLVKIVNIPSLNVRECAGPNCKIVSQVAENQIFIMQEKSVGWYKIKYSDNKSGWVYGQYVQEL